MCLRLDSDLCYVTPVGLGPNTVVRWIDLSSGLVLLGINDRLAPLPENRPPLSGPPEAEIEISPSSVGICLTCTFDR